VAEMAARDRMEGIRASDRRPAQALVRAGRVYVPSFFEPSYDLPAADVVPRFRSIPASSGRRGDLNAAPFRPAVSFREACSRPAALEVSGLHRGCRSASGHALRRSGAARKLFDLALESCRTGTRLSLLSLTPDYGCIMRCCSADGRFADQRCGFAALAQAAP